MRLFRRRTRCGRGARFPDHRLDPGQFAERERHGRGERLDQFVRSTHGPSSSDQLVEPTLQVFHSSERVTQIECCLGRSEQQARDV